MKLVANLEVRKKPEILNLVEPSLYLYLFQETSALFTGPAKLSAISALGEAYVSGSDVRKQGGCNFNPLLPGYNY